QKLIDKPTPDYFFEHLRLRRASGHEDNAGAATLRGLAGDGFQVLFGDAGPALIQFGDEGVVRFWALQQPAAYVALDKAVAGRRLDILLLLHAFADEIAGLLMGRSSDRLL